MSMDIVEQVQKKTDRREEGLLGTVNSFVHKLVGAGGVLLSGIILTVSGFDDPSASLADKYGGAVINKFVIIHLVIGMTLPFISTLLVLMYDIDRTKHNTHDFFRLTPSVVVIIPILKLENMNIPTAT